ncbi:hypothetical protein QJS04_geneDACA020878 [Acorus gramineus]|uniref:Uncharacterized protein n=1 Tax=Acorus gramineus TaxID=55184 RepID=A0AAV9BQ37_ACOGR|nr:hypothetical protein QJS04_geneDACA020878 [Acorus gramineus]
MVAKASNFVCLNGQQANRGELYIAKRFGRLIALLIVDVQVFEGWCNSYLIGHDYKDIQVVQDGKNFKSCKEIFIRNTFALIPCFLFTFTMHEYCSKLSQSHKKSLRSF